MKVGITGHQRLADPSGWSWVKSHLDAILGQCPPPLTGISLLAIGADQLFADAVLRHGGILEAIIPFDDYESKFPEGSERGEYHRLLEMASTVEVLPRAGSDEESYLAAGKRLVEISDLLVAVWDGKPAAGLGGTADVVGYAQEMGKGTIHINPVTRLVVGYP